MDQRWCTLPRNRHPKKVCIPGTEPANAEIADSTILNMIPAPKGVGTFFPDDATFWRVLGRLHPGHGIEIGSDRKLHHVDPVKRYNVGNLTNKIFDSYTKGE
jgi:hypothetical protein